MVKLVCVGSHHVAKVIASSKIHHLPWSNITGIPCCVMSAGVMAQVVSLACFNYAVFFALIITHVASSSTGLTDTHRGSFY